MRPPLGILTSFLLLLLLPSTSSGPPYACLATPPAGNGRQWSVVNWGSGDYNAALFGALWSEVNNCQLITADPRLANAPLLNAADVRGKIALVYRDPDNVKKGRTSFVQKALHAQNAGAVMAIVVNHKNDRLRPADVARGHDGPVGIGTTVRIPVIAVPHRIGQQLLAVPHALLSLMYDYDDMPEPTSYAVAPPVCVVQTPGDALQAAQQHYQDGVSLRSAKRQDEAAEAFRKAVALHPRHADALNELGSVMSNHKKLHRQAGKLFHRAMDVEPTEALFARNKQVTRTKMKETTVALGEEWSAT